MLELDGSVGEGGGQVLRVALAISAVTSKPLKIYNIRKKRSNPGLRHQHLTAVKAVQEACGGEVRGASVGSSEIFFMPGKISKTSVDLDTGTAGSTTLVLQSLLPVLCFGKEKAFFRIKGGTNNPNAPTFEYFQQVFMTFLRKIGVDAQVDLKRRGFYPRGGGTVEGYVSPVKSFPSFDFTAPPNLLKASIHAYTSRLPSHVAERMTKACRQVLLENGIGPVDALEEVLTESDPRCAADPGAGIFVFGDCEPLPMGVDVLGEKGVPAEKVGRNAAEAFLNELWRREPVDSHLGDMMVVYAALAHGVSKYRVTNLTNHTVTSVEVCRALLGIRAVVEGKLGERAVITVEGCGFVNNNIQG
ncbi:MAG: RNA 3'-terminal phosphate cyclase [Candidatus Caldarchaeum sp.]|nr:RNA 3'-terminal phosphate cyclase [Candidatus Caldarchaeum sp.]